MKLYQSMFVALVVIAVIGDVSHFVHNLGAAPGSELSRNSYSLISGSEAGLLGSLAKAVARAVRKSNVKKSSAGHKKNKRPSNKEKHQKADARRQRDQQNSDGQKGGKGGKRGNKKKND